MLLIVSCKRKVFKVSKPVNSNLGKRRTKEGQSVEERVIVGLRVHGPGEGGRGSGGGTTGRSGSLDVVRLIINVTGVLCEGQEKPGVSGSATLPCSHQLITENTCKLPSNLNTAGHTPETCQTN